MISELSNSPLCPLLFPKWDSNQGPFVPGATLRLTEISSLDLWKAILAQVWTREHSGMNWFLKKWVSDHPKCSWSAKDKESWPRIQSNNPEGHSQSADPPAKPASWEQCDGKASAVQTRSSGDSQVWKLLSKEKEGFVAQMYYKDKRRPFLKGKCFKIKLKDISIERRREI